jgi:bacterioferritin-associated ferredoxin
VYICLCHGFTDKQVKTAIAEGRRTVSDVYTRLGARPRCGKCVAEVSALVSSGSCGGNMEIAAAGLVSAPQTE